MKLKKANKGLEKLAAANPELTYKKAQGGTEVKPLMKMTMGGGDLLGAMVAAQPRPSMGDGGEKYKYTIGGQTYSGKKKSDKDGLYGNTTRQMKYGGGMKKKKKKKK